MDDSDLQDARHDDDDDEGPVQLSIDRVTRVSLGKLRWFPETHEFEGKTYASLSRFDPQLVKVITGKGMNRHAKRRVWGLDVQWWAATRQLRPSLFVSAPFVFLTPTYMEHT